MLQRPQRDDERRGVHRGCGADADVSVDPTQLALVTVDNPEEPADLLRKSPVEMAAASRLDGIDDDGGEAPSGAQPDAGEAADGELEVWTDGRLDVAVGDDER